MSKPVFEPASSCPGVARAWRARKPALDRNASETSVARASSRRRAASLAARPSTTFTSAVRRISQKWVGRCSQCGSALGSTSSSTSPASGNASRRTATAIARAYCGG
jgi:hypothetical protein